MPFDLAETLRRRYPPKSPGGFASKMTNRPRMMPEVTQEDEPETWTDEDPLSAVKTNMAETVRQAFGGKSPTFEGSMMIDPHGSKINLDDQDEVAEYATFIMDAIPDPERSDDQEAPYQVASGVRSSDPNAQVRVVPRIQMEPMEVSARRPTERQRMPLSQMLGGRGALGADLSGVSAEENPRTQSRRGDVQAEILESIIEKTGIDPTQEALPRGFNVSTLAPRERFMLRQLGALGRSTGTMMSRKVRK